MMRDLLNRGSNRLPGLIMAGLLLFGTAVTVHGATPLLMEELTTIRSLGESWLFSNLADNGLFVYSWNPASGEVSRQNNELRQLMASRVLAARCRSDSLLLPVHRRNLDFILTNWYREVDGIGHILYEGKSKLGANAMLLRTLLCSPDYEDHAAKAKAVADGILFLQLPDGSFEPWMDEPDYEYDKDRLMTFYSGEGLLALTEYYNRTRDRKYLKSAEKGAEFYLREYVDDLMRNYYPAYVPWHTMACRNLYLITGKRKYIDAIFVLNDKLLELQDTTVAVGRFYNPKTPQYGNPHASSDGVYTEGLGYAYEMARAVGDSGRAESYLAALELGIRNIASLQYRAPLPDSPVAFEKYRGAIRTNRTNNRWVRIDNTQHAIDAVEHLEEVLRSAPR